MSNFADIACPASPQLESATTASPDGRPKDSATFAGSRSRKTPDVPEGEMHGHGSGGPKDVWTHNVEATASLLIAFGTLITTCSAQGLFTPSTASRWILEYLVPFQLPIFYFCLGFLYQRYRTTRTPRAWGQNLRRELALMGIPFAAFTVLVLLTNSAVGAKPPLSVADLLRALFIEPVIPVGYFYTCLIIYAITPTVKSRRNASGLLFAAVAAKAAIVALASLPATAEMATRLPYAVTSVAENWIWVAGGMAMALYRGLPLVRGSEKAWALGALWVATSVIAFYAGWTGETSHAVLDALGVLWATSLFSTVFRSGRQNRFYDFVTRYTMAIWLFHGICLALYFHLWKAAGISIAAAPWMAAVGAALVCYGMPVLIMAVLSRLGKAGIIVYPARYLPPAPATMLRKTPHKLLVIQVQTSFCGGRPSGAFNPDRQQLRDPKQLWAGPRHRPGAHNAGVGPVRRHP
ncbi:MAG: acyltransferase family protein [Adlercreutzia sp.]